MKIWQYPLPYKNILCWKTSILRDFTLLLFLFSRYMGFCPTAGLQPLKSYELGCLLVLWHEKEVFMRVKYYTLGNLFM
jgi:hypothetical protein